MMGMGLDNAFWERFYERWHFSKVREQVERKDQPRAEGTQVPGGPQGEGEVCVVGRSEGGRGEVRDIVRALEPFRA